MPPPACQSRRAQNAKSSSYPGFRSIQGGNASFRQGLSGHSNPSPAGGLKNTADTTFDTISAKNAAARLRKLLIDWRRPLIADAHGSASDISRTHEIRNPERGWWDVAGGKLTTYRLIAEQAVDQIVAREKWRLPTCSTAEEPLLKPEETAGVSGILPPPCSKSTVAHYCAHEWAAHLDDVMIRRASWHHYHEDASQKAAQVADWMAEFLHWPTDEQARELSQYRSLFSSQSYSQPSMPRLTTPPGSLAF
jgi:hypothetical protein